MADVFEVEANASQDANYREHLNRNWQNGNTEFDKLEKRLNALESSINGYQEEFDQLKQDVDTLIRRINDFNETIEEQDTRISKLENAVFGLAPADITTPPTPDYPNSGMVEINFDDRKDKK